eukprot:TRINITY_DN15536_c0_g4_i1.p1 TRINITY_DN15536_c0_g4~~TRINITY_DN15536_c0_g4_i1.p1  ORF type:complete len:2287 (+),score=447.60 TRINITY_DN15536_c0_g4_i1:81-6941(+)
MCCGAALGSQRGPPLHPPRGRLPPAPTARLWDCALTRAAANDRLRMPPPAVRCRRARRAAARRALAVALAVPHWWEPCGGAVSSTSTFTVTLPTGSTTATFTLPTVTGSRTSTFTLPSTSGTVTLPSASPSEMHTFTLPSASPSDSATLPSVSSTRTATSSLPTNTDTAALPTISASVTSTYTLPAQTNSWSTTIPSASSSVTASASLPTQTASARIPSATNTGTETYTLPRASATSTVTLPTGTSTRTGTATLPGATPSAVIPTATNSETATYTLPRASLTATLTMPSWTGTKTGTATLPEATPSAVIPTATSSETATYTLPRASLTQSFTMPTSSGTTTGTATLPVATESFTLPTATLSMTETFTLPSDSHSNTVTLPTGTYSRSVSSTLPTTTTTLRPPTVTPTLTATLSIPSHTLTVSVTLPSVSASRTVTSTLPAATTTHTLPTLTVTESFTLSLLSQSTSQSVTLPTLTRSLTATYTLPQATPTAVIPTATSTRTATYTLPTLTLPTRTHSSTMSATLPQETMTSTASITLPSETETETATASATLTLPTITATSSDTFTLAAATSTASATHTLSMPTLTASPTQTVSATLPSLSDTLTASYSATLPSQTLTETRSLTPRWAPWQLLRVRLAADQPQNSWGPITVNGSESMDPLLSAGLAEGAAVYRWSACFRAAQLAACEVQGVPAAVRSAIYRANAAGNVDVLSTGAEHAGGVTGTLELTLTATHPPTYRVTSGTIVTRLEPRGDLVVAVSFPLERPVLHRPGAPLLLKAVASRRGVVTGAVRFLWNCTGVDLGRHRLAHPSPNYLSVAAAAFPPETGLVSCTPAAFSLSAAATQFRGDPVEIRIALPPTPPDGTPATELGGMDSFGADLTASVDPAVFANVDGKALWARFAYVHPGTGTEVDFSAAWERITSRGLAATFKTPLLLNEGVSAGTEVVFVTYTTTSPLGASVARHESLRPVAVPAPPPSWDGAQLARHGSGLVASGLPDALVSAAHIAANLRGGSAEDVVAGGVLAEEVLDAAAVRASGLPAGNSSRTVRQLLDMAVSSPATSAPVDPDVAAPAPPLVLAAEPLGRPAAAVRAALREADVPADARAALSAALAAAEGREAALRREVRRALDYAGPLPSLQSVAEVLNASLRLTPAEAAAAAAALGTTLDSVGAAASAGGAAAQAAGEALATGLLPAALAARLGEAASAAATARQRLQLAAAAAQQGDLTESAWTGAEAARAQLTRAVHDPDYGLSRISGAHVSGSLSVPAVDPGLLAAAGTATRLAVESAGAADIAALLGVSPLDVFAWLRGSDLLFDVRLPSVGTDLAGQAVSERMAGLNGGAAGQLPQLSAKYRELDPAAPAALDVSNATLSSAIFRGDLRLPPQVDKAQLGDAGAQLAEAALAADLAAVWGVPPGDVGAVLSTEPSGTVAAFQVSVPAAGAWGAVGRIAASFADLPIPGVAAVVQDRTGREHRGLAVRESTSASFVSTGYVAEQVRGVLSYPDMPPGASLNLSAALRGFDAAALGLQVAAAGALADAGAAGPPLAPELVELQLATDAAAGGLGTLFSDDDSGRAAFGSIKESALTEAGEAEQLRLRAELTGRLRGAAHRAAGTAGALSTGQARLLAAAVDALDAQAAGLSAAVAASVAAPGLSPGAVPLLAHAAAAAVSAAPSGRPARLSRAAADRVLDTVLAAAESPPPLARSQLGGGATLRRLVAAAAAALEQIHRDIDAARAAQQSQPGDPARESGGAGSSKVLDAVPEERFRAQRVESALRKIAAAAARGMAPAEGESTELAALSGNASAPRPAVSIIIDRIAPSSGVPNPIASHTCSVDPTGRGQRWLEGRGNNGVDGLARAADLGNRSLPARLLAAAGTALVDIVQVSQGRSTHWWQAVGGGGKQSGGVDEVRFVAVEDPSAAEPVPGVSLQSQQWMLSASPQRTELRLLELDPAPVVWLHQAVRSETPQRPLQCVYWDASRAQWAADGVEAVRTPAGSTACATSHFTEFAMVLPPLAPPPPPPVPTLRMHPPPSPPPPPPSPIEILAADDDCPPSGCPWWWPVAVGAGLCCCCAAAVVALVCRRRQRPAPDAASPHAAKRGPSTLASPAGGPAQRVVCVGPAWQVRPLVEATPALANLGWCDVYAGHCSALGVVADEDHADGTVMVRFDDGATVWYPVAALQAPPEAGNLPFGGTPARQGGASAGPATEAWPSAACADMESDYAGPPEGLPPEVYSDHCGDSVVSHALASPPGAPQPPPQLPPPLQPAQQQAAPLPASSHCGSRPHPGV